MKILFLFLFTFEVMATPFKSVIASPFSSDIPGTLQAAKKEKKPILIDFFGIWCPPCNELDETVFESTEFLTKARAFKLLKVDADAPGSWKIKSKYKVGGYPTILFTDYKGSEVYRITGYRPRGEFLRVMEMVLSSKGRPIEEACKSDSVEDQWRCAVICSERKDKKCLEASLKKLEGKVVPGSVTYELARTLAVENAATEDLQRDGYEKLMSEFPASPMAYLWASSYFELFNSKNKVEPRKEMIEKVLSNYTKAIVDNRKEEMGVVETDMAQIRADLLEKLGKMEEAKVAWKEAAALLDKFAATLPKSMVARGFTLEKIGCLEASGQLEEALKLSNEYRNKFPKEFTFHYVAAGILERQKKYSDALLMAKEALQYSYGDNKIRVATALVRLYGVLADRQAAKLLYESISKEFNPSPDLEVRTHRYLIKLQETYLKMPK